MAHTQKHKDQQDAKRESIKNAKFSPKHGKGGPVNPRKEKPTPQDKSKKPSAKKDDFKPKSITRQEQLEARNKTITAKGPGKMPDGYNMKRPAEKLGYIQKLGAGRMSPGKMGDMTAMKMMHGDAAAKYYDGAGMYMNGAPKYEGASKSYMGAMKHMAGHEEPGSDRPSYTQTSTSQVVVPGTSSSTDTSSSGGSTSSTSNYDKLMSTKKDLGPDFKPTKEQTAKANEEVRLAKAKDKAESEAKKNSVKTSTKPSVKTEVKKEKKTSKVAGQSEMKSSFAETEANRKSRYNAGRDELVNLAKQDSANVAQSYLKSRPLTKQNILEAAQRGEKKGNLTVQQGTRGRGSFGEKNNEFRFSKEEANQLFNPNLGKAQVNVTKGTRKTKKGTDMTRSHPTYNKSYTQGDVGKEVSFGKKGKGKATITSVSSQTGSQGSYGGFDTAEGYMQSMKGGTPKMPKGPMKFGMKK